MPDNEPTEETTPEGDKKPKMRQIIEAIMRHSQEQEYGDSEEESAE